MLIAVVHVGVAVEAATDTVCPSMSASVTVDAVDGVTVAPVVNAPAARHIREKSVLKARSCVSEGTIPGPARSCLIFSIAGSLVQAGV
jgi:hypothetical protein